MHTKKHGNFSKLYYTHVETCVACVFATVYLHYSAWNINTFATQCEIRLICCNARRSTIVRDRATSRWELWLQATSWLQTTSHEPHAASCEPGLAAVGPCFRLAFYSPLSTAILYIIFVAKIAWNSAGNPAFLLCVLFCNRNCFFQCSSLPLFISLSLKRHSLTFLNIC